MARIRTIKPEFWDSPSTAQAGPWARLAFIAMWNWADDYGRGTANLKELEGFAFPNDDTFTDRSGNTVHFRDVVAEVSECFGVVLYEVDGRPYYEIPSWDRHQRNERRAAQSKHPGPPSNTPPTSGNAAVAEMHGISATQERKTVEAPNTSGTGTGEQGNRGTGECSDELPLADPPKTQARKKTPYPDDWEPAPNQIAWADEHNIDVWAEADKFRTRNLRDGSKYANWDMAFASWLRLGNEKGWAAKKQPAKTGLGCANPFEGW